MRAALALNGLKEVYCPLIFFPGLTEPALFELLNMMQHFHKLSLEEVKQLSNNCFQQQQYCQQQIPNAHVLRMLAAIKMFLKQSKETR